MSESLFGDESPDCPQCGLEEPRPVIYGRASEEMVTAAKLGHIVLGGEEVPEAHRLWQCQGLECEYRF
ncbi:MAG: hypothetical protein F2556_01485 [Actinobacteria bacterium]|jgi:hypothetical protein|nr:hypothetical protein [Actinomycetota bacterium]